MLCWLDVDVHKVSAIKLIKKEKALGLDAGYWLSAAAGCETLHIVVFFFSSLRLSRPRRSLIQGASPAGPVFSEGTELAPSADCWYVLPWPFKCFPSSRYRPAAGGPLLCSEPAGDFIKVAFWALGKCPALPEFSFQCKSIRKVLLTSTVPHTERAVTKCLSSQGLFFSFFEKPQ